MFEVVIKKVRVGKRGHIYDLFRCICGNLKIVARDAVKSGKIRSCGCLRDKLAGERGRLKKGIPITHGLSRSPEYVSYYCMKTRCNNPNAGNYSYYGGIGVKICKEWETFEQFYADMGPREKGMSLDRIDPFGNYEPNNCRWATKKEQIINQRNKK